MNLRQRKHLIIGFACGIGAIVVGLCAWWILYFNHPQKILADAIGHLARAESGGFIGDLSVSPSVTAPKSFTLHFEGESTRQAAHLDASVTKQDLTVAGQLFTNQHATWLQLKNPTEIAKKAAEHKLLAPFSTQLQTSAVLLHQKWLKIDRDSQKLDIPCTNILAGNPLRGDQQEQLITLFKRHQFVAIGEKQGQEKIAGAMAVHYKVRFDAAKATEFSSEVQKIEPFKSSGQCAALGASASYKELFTKLAQADIEIWVDKRTHKPRKIVLQLIDDQVIRFTLQLNLDKKVTLTPPGNNIITPKELLDTIAIGR